MTGLSGIHRASHSQTAHVHRVTLRPNRSARKEQGDTQRYHDRCARDCPRACAMLPLGEIRMRHHPHNFLGAAKPPSFFRLSPQTLRR